MSLQRKMHLKDNNHNKKSHIYDKKKKLQARHVNIRKQTTNNADFTIRYAKQKVQC